MANVAIEFIHAWVEIEKLCEKIGVTLHVTTGDFGRFYAELKETGDELFESTDFVQFAGIAAGYIMAVERYSAESEDTPTQETADDV